MNKAMHLLLIGLSVILASCGKPPAADEADPQRDQGPKARLTVVGVDRTESWEAMTQLTLGLAEHVLSEAKPGDTLVFRWISDRSYAPSEQFTRVTLPAIERPTSRLDRQGQQRYLAARRALAGAYQDGMRQIRRFVPGSADHPGTPDLRQGTPATDLMGFVTAAAEVFATAPPESAKVLVVIGDLQDNRNFDVKPDLQGVDVVVHLVSRDADPTRAQLLKERWTAFFTERGAQSVTFMPVSAQALSTAR
jgi:hypothetical protein